MKDGIALLKKAQRIMLICHISVDGDTLGSALALRLMLLRLQKSVQVVCADAIPANYTFMPGAGEVLFPHQVKETPDLVVAVDCGDISRLGEAQGFFDRCQNTMVIDHHVTNKGFAKVNLLNFKAAATGEIIYALIKKAGIKIDAPMATCLYVGISTDTGHFMHSNTTVETYHIAAQLIKTGIETTQICEYLYNCQPYAKVKLTGQVIAGIKLYADQRIAVSIITLEQMASIGAKMNMTEGLIDYIRKINTVEVAALIVEKAPAQYKISMRSRSTVDVSKVANEFGGGGHIRAAGCHASGHLPDIIERLTQTIAKQWT